MATNGPKVSNGIVSNNPDFFTRADPDVNNKYRQVVRLDVGVGTAESLVNSVSVGLPGNITQVGGVAVTLGQKAETASIPVVLATEQDTAQPDSGGSGPYTATGVYDGFNLQWYPTPCDQAGIPYSTIATDESSNRVSLLAKLTAPTAAELGVVTRNIPSGTQTVDGTVKITDVNGGPIVSVEDQIMLTGTYAPLSMGYDPSLGQFAPLPLSNGGTSVAVANIYASAVYPNAYTSTGTITTSTSTVVLTGITGQGGVCISIRGTYAGVNFTPEVSSDGTTYTTVSMSRQDTPQLQQTSGALTNTTRMWIAPTLGCTYFRVRATAWTSGTATINLFASLAAVPTAVQTLPSGTQTITGTVTANPVLTTSGGGLPYKYLDLNNTGQVVKAGKAYLSDIYVYNNTGATIYVKVYNKATAATSADTPVQVYGVKAGDGTVILGVQGVQLATGCSIRCTTGVADADTTSPAANGCVFSCTYT